MEPTLLIGVAVLLLSGLVIIWLGMARPGWSEFWDRPICWLTGQHDLVGPLYRTTYEGHPAEVYRCRRHQVPVTIVDFRSQP